MSNHIGEIVASDSQSKVNELTSLLIRAAEASRQNLLRLYCAAETSILKQHAEECYQYIHWIWHHCPCFSSFQQAPSSACPQSTKSDSDASVVEQCLTAVAFDASRDDDAIHALKRVAHILLEYYPTSGTSGFERLRACTINCEQFQFIQSKLAKLRDLQAKAEASAANTTSDATSTTVDASNSNNSDSDSQNAKAQLAQSRTQIHAQITAEFRALPSCNTVSCHLQLQRDVTASALASSAVGDGFHPFLMMLHSVFLLRFFFYYVFHENALIQSSESVQATPRLPSVSESSPFHIQPKLSTFCHAFSQWPAPLHAAVHTFADNLQFCSYAHMIVALRGQGGGADSLITAPSSSSTASAVSSSQPPQFYQLDTRFWRKVLFDLKQKSELITSDDLRKVLQQMNLASHSTYLMPSVHSLLLAPSPSISPSLQTFLQESRTPRILHVMGDSHSLSLHTQWLFCFLQRRQQFRWMQMQSHIIIGLKAFHVGQLLAKSTNTNTPADLADLATSLQTRTLLAYAHRVPPGSNVLFVAGEIDCRTDEGLLQAVEKGKYASVDEAIQLTVRGYLGGLQRLARAHKWRRILIHSVCAPYLAGNKMRMVKKGWKDLKEEDRRQQQTGTHASPVSQPADDTAKVPSLLSRVHIRALLIRDFNAELKKQIEFSRSDISASSSSSPSSDFSLHLLDFYPDLCTTSPDTASMENPPLLRAEFTLEGMHLNTKYTPLIERELEKILDF